MRNGPDEWPPLGEELCSPAPTARFRPVVIATQIEASPYQILFFLCISQSSVTENRNYFKHEGQRASNRIRCLPCVDARPPGLSAQTMKTGPGGSDQLCLSQEDGK